jgi:hypothetical protein
LAGVAVGPVAFFGADVVREELQRRVFFPDVAKPARDEDMIVLATEKFLEDDQSRRELLRRRTEHVRK